MLADCMHFAGTEYRPTAMLTLATLTGAIAVALGQYWAGLYTDSATLADELLAAAASSGDSLWRMPLGPRAMRDKMRSPVADLRHMGAPEEPDSVYAATFLRQFAPVKRWAHIDCAGTVYNEKKEVPTGWGPMLVADWLAARAGR